MKPGSGQTRVLATPDFLLSNLILLSDVLVGCRSATVRKRFAAFLQTAATQDATLPMPTAAAPHQRSPLFCLATVLVNLPLPFWKSVRVPATRPPC